MLLDRPETPGRRKGIEWELAAIRAMLSEGVTKKFFPRIMLRSASPSQAAPKSGAYTALSKTPIFLTRSSAYVRLGSGWPWPKSGSTLHLKRLLGLIPKSSPKIFLA